MKTRYCVGFMFDKTFSYVALIRKLKPDWQKDKLNGIGGHIENNETPLQSMRREFHEEAEYPNKEKWIKFAKLHGSNNDKNIFELFCFTSIGEPFKLKSKTDEKIEIIQVVDLHPSRKDMIENVSWLIGMAIDKLTDGRPFFSNIKYK